MKFILSAEESELLTKFESHPSLESLAKATNRDPTVISKQLKRIATKGDFLAKVSGRWALTDMGRKFSGLVKDFVIAQNKIINEDAHLVIGATREFSTIVLAKHFKKLEAHLGVKSITILSFENGVEQALLKGQIDIGFDCGRPYSPEILFQQEIKEPISAVSSKSFLKQIKHVKKFKELEEFPHILCDRLFPDRIFHVDFKTKKIAMRTNDISTARNACLAGVGWALLPEYCMQEELQKKKLIPIQDFRFVGEKIGVWTLRSRKTILPYYNSLLSWIKNHQ